MKVYIETTYMKYSHYEPLFDMFKQIVFTTEVDPECEILIGMYDDQNDAFFDQFPKLKLIMLLSSGFDHLYLSYFKQRGVMITNAKGLYDIQIAEDVVSKMLYFNRRMFTYYDQMKKGVWKHENLHFELYERQALILGAGSIGQLIARRLKGFDMETVGYKRTYEELEDFDHIITDMHALNKAYQTCDYLIIALPLNTYTNQMINRNVLSQLKKDCLIVNIGRGEIIDQEALIEALNNGLIRGAALDVTYPEPLPKDHPLWKAKNLYISPHNASASPMVKHRRVQLIKSLLDLYIDHKSLFNVVLDNN